MWTTTTQALADQVLKDTETFTIRKDDGTVAGLRWWMPGIVRTLANSVLCWRRYEINDAARSIASSGTIRPVSSRASAILD